jgi:hypothetical protein
MNIRHILSAALLALATFGVAAPADANHVVGTTISGRLSGVSGGDTLIVDGHNYRVKSGSPAAKALATLAPGVRVELMLDGPADKPASRVVVVNVMATP